MASSNKPPAPAGADGTITGTFVVDEVMAAARRERPLVSVVLPAFDEAAILREHVVVLLDYLKTLSRRYRFEIIIVNDGSRDQTGAIAAQLAADFDGIRVFDHRRNFGLGQALKTGFARCRGQYVVVLDIDLSYGPEHVGMLLDRITGTGARLVLASPYMRGGRVIEVPWLRVLFSRVANWFLARASGERISTMTCMVRAIDGRFLRSLHLRSTGMDVMPEMIHKAKLLRASIEEVPAELNWERQNRAGGKRRSSLRIVRQIFGTTVSGFILRPFTFLLVPGLLLLAFAAYVDTWMVIHFVDAYGELSASADTAYDMSAAVALAYERFPHTFIVGLLSLMLAMQLIGMAMLSLQNKKYFDELFHLGSTLLRERREADLRLEDAAAPARETAAPHSGGRPGVS
ncbi:MAG TPA: glycosyltransferase family 2 protein [Steroidobacteraceae bacterium]|nr:glycosyltransferase family 2 protein [Steroidobacteraceae bacterium]